MQSEYRVGQKLMRNDGVIGLVTETTPKGRFVTVRWMIPALNPRLDYDEYCTCKYLRKISTIIKEAPHDGE